MSAMSNLVLEIQESVVDILNGECSVDSVAKRLGVPVEWVLREFDAQLMAEGYNSDAYN